MTAMDETQAAQQDYRSIHLEVGRHYDARLADSPFDHYMAVWEQRRLAQLLARFYPHGVQRYLDFACGTGRVTEQVAPLAAQSVGVDISPTMIEQARRKCPGTRFELADLTQGEVDLGQFDLITSFRFFGNAQDELREGALRAIVARLALGGHLVINSHRNPRALYALFNRLGGSGDPMDLSWGKLRRLLARHGLEPVAVQPIGAWMFRTRLMVTTAPDSPRALRNEARFAAPAWAAIAPDTIVVARKR